MTPQRLLVYLLIIAFVAAPFLGLLYGPALGLIMLILAIALTLGLIIPVRQHAAAYQQQRLDTLIRINWALLIASVLGLLITLIA